MYELIEEKVGAPTVLVKITFNSCNMNNNDNAPIVLAQFRPNSEPAVSSLSNTTSAYDSAYVVHMRSTPKTS